MKELETEIQDKLKNWAQIVSKYQKPNIKKAIWQLVNTFVPFLGLWVLMYFSLDWSYWITLALALINGFMMVRIFIIQHDCGHRSFFKNQKLNNLLGFICSSFSSIPYRFWAGTHHFHHAHNGQLEVTNIGDVKTLTVDSYRRLNWFKKFRYRLYRNPFVLFVLGPIYYISFSCRTPIIPFKGWKKFKWSLWANNVYLILFYALMAAVIGWKKFFLVQIPIIAVFAIIAVWFFYVQHQHEETYKQWKNKWDYLMSAIKGSTYYKLPKVFQWFSGNIGYHHIHHLNPKIPNYNLEKCAKENPVLNRYVRVMTFFESLKCIFNHLWDEESQRMISFREFRRLEKHRMAA